MLYSRKSDQADATWQNVQYLGRFGSYIPRFTRQYRVMYGALSVEETPTIYIVGLTKPSSIQNMDSPF